MPERQAAMVIDLNKCIGCHACSVACKKLWTDNEGMQYMYWNNVETRPGAGYPRNWEELGGGFQRNHLQRGKLPEQADYGHPWQYNYEERLFEGKEGRVEPDEDPEWGPNWDDNVGDGQYPNTYFYYLPRLCNHCTQPACLEACPRDAVYKRQEDGIVLIDEERCRGYRRCIQACPYKKIYYNAVKDIGQKCIFCYPRLEEGVANSCAGQCVGRVRFVGFLDDGEGPIYRLVNEWKVALPLHPEYETGPNVFYIPPMAPPALDNDGNPAGNRIPRAHLKALFGKEVERVLEILKNELDRVQRGEESELLTLLIGKNADIRFGLEGFEAGAE